MLPLTSQEPPGPEARTPWDPPDPLRDLGRGPLGEGGFGTQKAADVPAAIDELEAGGFGSLFGRRLVGGRADEDALGRFGEVAHSGPGAEDGPWPRPSPT
jgi:hypothetical protein